MRGLRPTPLDIVVDQLVITAHAVFLVREVDTFIRSRSEPGLLTHEDLDVLVDGLAHRAELPQQLPQCGRFRRRLGERGDGGGEVADATGPRIVLVSGTADGSTFRGETGDVTA